MTVSYPLSLPNGAISRLQMFGQDAVALSESPFTFQAQVVEHDGDRWVATVALPIMNRAGAADWQAFITSLRGRKGTFLLRDTSYQGARGTPGGTPIVNGADQVGETLVTDGWTSGTLVLKAGDLFSIENRLYMSLTDVTSDGSGNATIDIWPNARNPSDNATIVYTDPAGLFRLSSNVRTIIDADPAKLYTLTFAAQEAL